MLSFKNIKEFRKKQENFDLIILNGIRSLNYALASCIPLDKCILIKHTPTNIPTQSKTRTFLKHLIANLSSFRLKNIVCVSLEIRQEFKFNLQKAIFIPNFSRSYANQSIPWNERDYDLIYCGRLEAAKGIRWLKNIATANDNLKIIICGDGREQDFIKKLCLENKNISYLGIVNDIGPMLANTRYNLLLSESEGMPLSVLEAMSCGCIPILSDIKPHVDLIGKNFLGYTINANSESISKFFAKDNFRMLAEFDEEKSKYLIDYFSKNHTLKIYFHRFRKLLNV